MFDRYQHQGTAAALARFGLKQADAGAPAPMGASAPMGLMSKMKSFGQGQLDAGKALLGNLRGGLGGASPHGLPEGAMGPMPDAAGHRAMAVGNLKTLAPSLLAGGALYMMHRHKKQQEALAQQQAMQQQGYGQPMM